MSNLDFDVLAYSELPNTGVRISTRGIGTRYETTVMPMDDFFVVDFALWPAGPDALEGHLMVLEEWREKNLEEAANILEWHRTHPITVERKERYGASLETLPRRENV